MRLSRRYPGNLWTPSLSRFTHDAQLPTPQLREARMGFSLKRMFKHPFGSHSLFHNVTHNPLTGVALSFVPGGGLAKSLIGAGRGVQRAIAPALPVLHALTTPGTPATPTALPGGAAVGAQPVPHHRAHRHGKRTATVGGARRAARGSTRVAGRSTRKGKRKARGRKLKFGSPAYRRKYLGHR